MESTVMEPSVNDTDPICYHVTADATDVLSYTPIQRKIITILLPILLSFGILNNIAFLFVVCRVHGMKTVTNACLANLAIADILFLVTAIGERLYTYCKSPIYMDATPIGLVGCELKSLITSTAYFAALCSITLVSMERYEGVCHPQRSHNRTGNGRKTYRWLLLVSWVGALIVSATFIPSYLKYDTICLKWPEEYSHWPDSWSNCQPVEKWWTTYKELTQAIPFIVAFIVSVVLYVNIVRGLSASVRRARLASVKMRNQIAWMLIVNGLVFFILLGPYEILSMVNSVKAMRTESPGQTSIILEEFFKCLSYANSAINPVIYISMSSRYRAAFCLVFIPPFGKDKFRKTNNASQNSAISSLLDICRDSQV